MPPGAKVIADCEGGARKFVYRRWGGAAASPSVAASAVRAASAMPARASEAATVRPTERVADSTVVVTPAAVAPVQPAASAAATAGQRATAFAAAHWPWLGGLAALVGGLWLWRTRFSGYDKDGLPRGPRL